MLRRILLVTALAAVATVVLPGVASAQFFDPESNGREYCADNGPNGNYPKPDPWSNLSLRMEPAGAGVVDARMYAMPPGADCIRWAGTNEGTTAVTPDRCPPRCELEVMSVCEVHCGDHKHSMPFDWPVRLTATSTGGLVLLGWRAQCVPMRNVGTSECVVQMNAAAAQTATAHFGPEPDSTKPAPAPVARATALGGYTIEVTWDPSADEWLAGYDITVDGALRSRVAPTAARKVRLTAKCNTAYTVGVAAYDFSSNTTPSAPVTVRTGACTTTGAGPRPNTAIHIKPQRTTKSRTAYFHFGTRGDIRATRGFQCKLDRGRWVKCSGANGKRYRALKKGYHTFQVRAGNGEGWDSTPAKWRWRIR